MTKPTPASRRSRRTTILALAVAFPVLALVMVGFLASSRPSAAARVPSPVPTAPAEAEPPSLYGPLLGRWARTDGDYLLEVRAVDGTGKAQVNYFNPSPIHVARAEAKRDGDQLTLVVVLEDVGYPGSYYTLHYSPTDKRLSGEYYQAALQETFEVIFTRLPQ
jgi:hypothetical protein